MTEKQTNALNMLFDYVENLAVAFQDTEKMILDVNESGLDANDFITKMYPFKQSFDDLVIDVKRWKEEVQDKIGVATYKPE